MGAHRVPRGDFCSAAFAQLQTNSIADMLSLLSPQTLGFAAQVNSAYTVRSVSLTHASSAL